MPFAVPAIAAALLAILAVLILYGTSIFAKAVAGLIPSNIPIIGRLHAIVLAIGAVAEAALSWIMADAIGPVFSFVIKPVLVIEQWIESVQNLARTVASSWSWLLNSAIPSVIAKLERYVIGKVNVVRAYALALYRDAQKYAAGLVRAARAYSLALYHDAIGAIGRAENAAKAYAAAILATEAHKLEASIVAARTYAAGLTNAARADLGKAIAGVDAEVHKIVSITVPDVSHAVAVGVQQAEAYANTAATAAVGAITTDVGHSVAAVFDGLIDDVKGLEGVIGTDLPDIGAAIRAIPRVVPTDLAGSMALSLGLAIPAIRFMEECGIPNCRNLSKIGRDLQSLFGAIEDAGFLALIGYMVSDPSGAADEAKNVLGPIASDLVGGARNLIGV